MSWISFIIDPKVRHRDQKPSKTETRRDPLSANYETVHCSGWRVSVSKGVLTSLSVIATISSAGGPRADVSPGHPPPRPRQRLQQCPLQRSVLGTVEAERHRHVHHDLHLHGVQHHPRVRHCPLHPRLRAR